jgi:hypothetical protein
MAVGGPAKPRQVIPGAPFHHHPLVIVHQGAGIFKHIACHVFYGVGATAEGKGGHCAGAIDAATAPVGGLIAPPIAPGGSNVRRGCGRLFPTPGRWAIDR